MLHRSEESHVDRLERASVLLEARDRTIDSLLVDSRRLSSTNREGAANEADNSAIGLDDLTASPGAESRAIADMSVSSLHSEVARLRGLLTEKEELIEVGAQGSETNDVSYPHLIRCLPFLTAPWSAKQRCHPTSLNSAPAAGIGGSGIS